MKFLASAEAKVVDNANLLDVEGFLKLSSDGRVFVRTADFKRDIVAYIETLQTNPNNFHSLEDIVNFTKDFPAKGYIPAGNRASGLRRNVLWNSESRKVILASLERSRILKRAPILQDTSPDRKQRHLHPRN